MMEEDEKLNEIKNNSNNEYTFKRKRNYTNSNGKKNKKYNLKRKVKQKPKARIIIATILIIIIVIIIFYLSIPFFNKPKKLYLVLKNNSNDLIIYNQDKNKINKIFTLSNESNDNNNNNNNNDATNKIIRKQLNYRNINTKEMNDFIKLCQNETLIGSIPKIVENPKISVVIPVYNAHEYLKKTLRSIQNQKMEEIEIIIVDDFSNDNTTEVVIKLQEEDPRIKFIKNKENRGTLYSRSIGALNAKAKYIMTIDNDDFFLPGIFDICYEEAEINNIDIIEFSGCDIVINKYVRFCKTCLFLRSKINGEIIRQPKLSTFVYMKGRENSTNYYVIDAYLWGKIIKSSIYKKALETIGEEIYSQYVCYCEDRVVNFALFRVASTFKFINRYGIIHNKNPKSVQYSWNNSAKILHDELINVESIYKLTKNTSDSFLAPVEFHNKWSYSEKGLTPENKERAQKIVNKMLDDPYIPEFRKNILIDEIKDKLDINNK